MGRTDPVRVRRAVYRGRTHLGYVTTFHYPDRDLDLLPEGTPGGEVVIADQGEGHLALLQRFKRHWLVRCGSVYETTRRAGDLTTAKVERLARFALSEPGGKGLAGAIAAELDRLLSG